MDAGRYLERRLASNVLMKILGTVHVLFSKVMDAQHTLDIGHLRSQELCSLKFYT